MADPPPGPDTGDDTGVVPNGESTTGPPRWVKVFGLVALAVILLFVILLLTKGPGGHGPSRHTSSSDPGGGTPLSSIAVADPARSGGLGDHAPPEAGHR